MSSTRVFRGGRSGSLPLLSKDTASLLPRWVSGKTQSQSPTVAAYRKLYTLVGALASILFLAGFVSLVAAGSQNTTSGGRSKNRKLGGHFAPDLAAVDSLETQDVQVSPDFKNPDDIQSNGIVSDLPHLGMHSVITSEIAQQRLPTPRGFYALHALDIDGNDVAFSQFAGKVLLVVNVASACGYTEQNYRGLQAIHEKYGSYGFEILAFPSNQFGGQEPGSDDHVKRFVSSRYGVTFRMMSKVDVNGPDAHPVFQYLKRHLPADQGGGGSIADGNDLVWNFNKFLVDKHGRPMAFYYQNFDGARLEADIFTYLSAT